MLSYASQRLAVRRLASAFADLLQQALLPQASWIVSPQPVEFGSFTLSLTFLTRHPGQDQRELLRSPDAFDSRSLSSPARLPRLNRAEDSVLAYFGLPCAFALYYTPWRRDRAVDPELSPQRPSSRDTRSLVRLPQTRGAMPGEGALRLLLSLALLAAARSGISSLFPVLVCGATGSSRVQAAPHTGAALPQGGNGSVAVLGVAGGSRVSGVLNGGGLPSGFGYGSIDEAEARYADRQVRGPPRAPRPSHPRVATLSSSLSREFLETLGAAAARQAPGPLGATSVPLLRRYFEISDPFSAGMGARAAQAQVSRAQKAIASLADRQARRASQKPASEGESDDAADLDFPPASSNFSSHSRLPSLQVSESPGPPCASAGGQPLPLVSLSVPLAGPEQVQGALNYASRTGKYSLKQLTRLLEALLAGPLISDALYTVLPCDGRGNLLLNSSDPEAADRWSKDLIAPEFYEASPTLSRVVPPAHPLCERYSRALASGFPGPHPQLPLQEGWSLMQFLPRRFLGLGAAVESVTAHFAATHLGARLSSLEVEIHNHIRRLSSSGNGLGLMPSAIPENYRPPSSFPGSGEPAPVRQLRAFARQRTLSIAMRHELGDACGVTYHQVGSSGMRDYISSIQLAVNFGVASIGSFSGNLLDLDEAPLWVFSAVFSQAHETEKIARGMYVTRTLQYFLTQAYDRCAAALKPPIGASQGDPQGVLKGEAPAPGPAPAAGAPERLVLASPEGRAPAPPTPRTPRGRSASVSGISPQPCRASGRIIPYVFAENVACGPRVVETDLKPFPAAPRGAELMQAYRANLDHKLCPEGCLLCRLARCLDLCENVQEIAGLGRDFLARVGDYLDFGTPLPFVGRTFDPEQDGIIYQKLVRINQCICLHTSPQGQGAQVILPPTSDELAAHLEAAEALAEALVESWGQTGDCEVSDASRDSFYEEDGPESEASGGAGAVARLRAAMASLPAGKALVALAMPFLESKCGGLGSAGFGAYSPTEMEMLCQEFVRHVATVGGYAGRVPRAFGAKATRACRRYQRLRAKKYGEGPVLCCLRAENVPLPPRYALCGTARVGDVPEESFDAEAGAHGPGGARGPSGARGSRGRGQAADRATDREAERAGAAERAGLAGPSGPAGPGASANPPSGPGAQTITLYPDSTILYPYPQEVAELLCEAALFRAVQLRRAGLQPRAAEPSPAREAQVALAYLQGSVDPLHLALYLLYARAFSTNVEVAELLFERSADSTLMDTLLREEAWLSEEAGEPGGMGGELRGLRGEPRGLADPPGHAGLPPPSPPPARPSGLPRLPRVVLARRDYQALGAPSPALPELLAAAARLREDLRPLALGEYLVCLSNAVAGLLGVPLSTATRVCEGPAPFGQEERAAAMERLGPALQPVAWEAVLHCLGAGSPGAPGALLEQARPAGAAPRRLLYRAYLQFASLGLEGRRARLLAKDLSALGFLQGFELEG